MAVTDCPDKQFDLESVARRILALTELATQEHLKALGRSQADRLVAMVQSQESEHPHVHVLCH